MLLCLFALLLLKLLDTILTVLGPLMNGNLTPIQKKSSREKMGD